MHTYFAPNNSVFRGVQERFISLFALGIISYAQTKRRQISIFAFPLRHTYSKTVGFFVLVATLVVIRTILSPWRTVRVALIYSSRVGHLVLEPYLALNWLANNAHMTPKTALTIYFKQRSDANVWLAKALFRNGVLMLNCPMLGWDFDTAFLVYQKITPFLLRRLPARVPIWDARNVSNFFRQSFSKPLKLKSREERLALGTLERIGIPNGAQWICVLNRSPRYMIRTQIHDFSYHSYRNSSISNYLLAATELAGRGFYVLRMGKFTEEDFESDNPRVIDYSKSRWRSDFMDWYLSSRCFFFLSSNTGIDAVASVHRRPIVLVNLVPSNMLNSFYRFQEVRAIFKHHVDSDNLQPIPLTTLIRSGATKFVATSQFDDENILLIENTPQEILDVSLEMLEYLLNPNPGYEASEVFQRQFRATVGLGDKPVSSRVGSQFLRENPSWLC